jgi:hypothetical protein
MNMPPLRQATAVLLCVFGTSTSAAAQTASLTSVADTTIGREEPTESNGAGEHMFVGATNNAQLRRALVRFDLSGIPAGARVTGASLTLTASRTNTGPQTLQVHALQAAWGEGTSNASGNEGRLAAATNDDATWVNRVHPATAWTTAGGDVAAMPDATVTTNGMGTVTFSSASVVAAVQRWVDNSATNQGWLVRNATETGTRTAIRFNTRENATVASRPVLQVTYAEAPLFTDTTPTVNALSSGNSVDGNGNLGFGGPVGQGSLHLDSDTAGRLTLGFVRGTGGNLNDTLVIYLDSVAGGEASTAAFNDEADASRVTISGVSGSNRATVVFPTGFRPDYAIAYDPDFGAFLFRLAAGGSHTFVATVAGASSVSAANAVFDLTLSQLGVASGARISLLGTYLSNTAFRSDEWLGVDAPDGNVGFSSFTIPSANFIRFQSFVDPCSPNPCLNGGMCTVAGNGSALCTCPSAFTGTRCEAPVCDPAQCEDNNPCTIEMCSGSTCMNVPGPAVPCNDGDRCTTDDVCSNGECVGGDPVVCTPASSCFDAVCNPVTGQCSQSADNSNLCSDGSTCTTDTCVAGTCMSVENGSCTSSSSAASSSTAPASSATEASSSAAAASSGATASSNAASSAESAGPGSSSATSSESAPTSNAAPSSGAVAASSSDAASSSAGASSAAEPSSGLVVVSSSAEAPSSNAPGSSASSAASVASSAGPGSLGASSVGDSSAGTSSSRSGVSGGTSRPASSASAAAASGGGSDDDGTGDGCACETSADAQRPWALGLVALWASSRLRRKRGR